MRIISGTLRSTPLPWLPVLSNIEPPVLRRKAGTDKLVKKFSNMTVGQSSLISSTDHCYDWYPGSRCGWTCNQLTVDIKSRWRHNWKSAQMVNFHLVCDPRIPKPGFIFNLRQQPWSLLNRFHKEQRHCGACTRKWRLTDTDLCPCGETQTIFHIVESCPLTKLNGSLSRLHSADEDAVSWLTSYGSWHAYEKKWLLYDSHVVY